MNIDSHLTTRREFVRNAAIGAVAFAFRGPLMPQSPAIPAIVSPDWLSKNLGDPKLIVLDIRNGEQYKKGHIAGSLNVPLSSWAVSRNGLTLELPQEDALRGLIANSGISPDSKIVVVNRVDTDFSRADMTRVAWTFATEGVENVAVLDGGYNRWVREIKSTSTEVVMATPVVYTGKSNPDILASKEYVLGRIGKAVIVDTRLPEEYFGVALKPGHIKGAISLPTPWVFSADGTFRKEDDLRAMADGVIGSNKSKEIILYCGFGGYATTWWFLLSRIFGYRNVRVYDGAMEEWVKDPAGPVDAYTWH